MKRMILLIAIAAVVSGCSVKKMAVNTIGNALAKGGSVYNSDDDPDLVRDALPFGLKTFESLLAVSPKHKGLLFSAANGFASYAYLLQQTADRIDARDFTEAQRLRARASKLYLRGRDFAFRGLELRHPDFRRSLADDPERALANTTAKDVPLLYLAGAVWAGALSARKDNVALIGALPVAAALVNRALELDESFDRGAAHEFFISYEGASPIGDRGKARDHYRRALELNGGVRASTHVALAEAVAVPEQNLEEFRRLLAAARAVDPDAVPELRLVNTLAIQRALWLERRIPELFFEAEGGQ